MGRKGSMNLQVITDSFVKDQSRRRNCQALSARIPTTPIKTQQRKLSSPEIELTSSPNKKPEVPVLSIQTAPKSAIPKASGPRSGFPTSAVPKSAFPSLKISTLVNSSNKTSGPKTPGPKTPLSASAKKIPGLSLQTPSSVIPEIDAPDTPVNLIYANAFFDNKTREDEETEAINKKVLKQQRKENIRNMRRERMKQPKDIRVALILGRLYDACNYELGPLSYWSDPEVENNEELKPKEVESNEEPENKPKRMIQLNPDIDEIEIEDEKEKNPVNEINHDKVNNVNAHPAWVPEEAGCSNVSCQKSATRVNGKLVKKNKKPYVAVASYFAKLYDPVLMKKREEEEKLKLIEKQRQNSIITELKPMGKSLNSRNQSNNSRQNNNGYNNNYNNYRNQGSQNHYQNRQNFNKNFNNTFNNNKYKKDEKGNDTFQTNFKENRNQPQPNTRSNFNSGKRSPTQINNYMSNNDYNQTYSYGYVYQYPVYQYYDPNMVPNYDYNNYGTGYGQNYTNNNNSNYYYNSSYDNQNKFKPRMNYHNNNQNTYNIKKPNEAFAFKKYEKKVNIKS
ncbi:hypothetical protein PIROE2DRAFT_5959 [Piromyces sp. E2]|nr:hypothetical protein PIROE2DRAFT_5959 [Piromyces sp. E2]|eukprot:OUM66747.1 hypothetical protein PIROE2DRAFT_5959 [Piromyces sp. E2]